MRKTTTVSMQKTVAGVRGTPLPPAKSLLFALLGTLLIYSITHATEPRQQGSAAWAMVMAKHRLTTVPKVTSMSCPCSSQCACGCNTGSSCRCSNTPQLDKTTSSGCQMVNGVMVCPNK